MTKSPKFTFHHVTPERWPDLEKLFGERGACGGCWCMVWRLKRSEWGAGKGKSNRLALKTIVERDDRPRILPYVGGEPLGWVSVAPPEEFNAPGGWRILALVDETPVWSISCLFVAKPYRRQGLSVKLIDAAVKFAANQGAKAVEAYPYVPYSDTMPAAFAWTGIASAFEQAGFREVARRSQAPPIMPRKC